MDNKDVLNSIKSPEELLEFMSSNICYGYLGKSGRVYRFDDLDFDEKWYDEYVLESAEQLLKTLCGNCWDQVELERYWFEKNGYEIKSIYEMVKLDYDNIYPTHSFLIFKDKDSKWCWFENSDSQNYGIHKFNSVDELLECQYNKYLEFLKTFNISDDEINKIIMTEFNAPKENCSARGYISFVINSKKIFDKDFSRKKK